MVKIGDIDVGVQGFGCMGITAFYGIPMEDMDGAALIANVWKAENKCTHFDTAELYRAPLFPSAESPDQKFNEVAVGLGVKSIGREKVTVATKMIPGAFWDSKTDAETVAKAVDESLKRLGLDYIDLYYLHRIPPQGAEEFMASCKPLVAAGKIKQVGLSECSAEVLRKAHAVHPVAAIQMEWSLVSRSIEDKIVPVCKELGIPIVAYSPLSRNLLTDQPGANTEGDNFRAQCPRFQDEALAKNKKMVAGVKAIAEAKKATVAQLSLAWLYYKAKELGVEVLPIPGTTKVPHFVENYAATKIELTAEEVSQLEALAANVVGERGNDYYMSMSHETLDKKSQQ